MIDERQEEQASLYVLGALSAAETAAFEIELGRDADLRSLVASLANSTAAMAGSVPQVSPPLALKQKILDQLGRREKIVPLVQPGPVKTSNDWLPWALAACFAVLCAVLGVSNNSLHGRVNQLAAMADYLQTQTNDLQRQVALLIQTNQIANLRIAMMDSLLADSPKAAAVVLWDEQTQRGMFVAQNLQPLPAGKDYQIWLVDSDHPHPVSGGTFKVDAQGRMRGAFKATDLVKVVNKVAVSLEDEGGVPVAKGPMVLLGE